MRFLLVLALTTDKALGQQLAQLEVQMVPAQDLDRARTEFDADLLRLGQRCTETPFAVAEQVTAAVNRLRRGGKPITVLGFVRQLDQEIPRSPGKMDCAGVVSTLERRSLSR